jgi:predicted RNA-binding Zn ribbon-like protein
LDLVTADQVTSLHRQAEREPARAATVLNTALRFRADLYEAMTVGADATGVAGVDRMLRRAAARRRLYGVGSGVARWSFDESGLELPLLAFVWSAYRLLDSGQGREVAACPGRRCGWLFLNHTGRRRWCSMRWCGNREKARRHAEKSGATRAAPRSRDA